MEEQAPHDLGNVRFRPRSRYAESTPEDAASTRFAIGIAVFLVAALAYPWYSYWVQTRLAARELEGIAAELSRQLEDQSSEVRQRVVASAAAREASSERRRLAGVRVMGVSLVRGEPVAIVELNGTSAMDSAHTICRQAAASIRQSMSGRTLRIQRYRRNLPAIDSGVVLC